MCECVFVFVNAFLVASIQSILSSMGCYVTVSSVAVFGVDDFMEPFSTETKLHFAVQE